MFGDKEIITCSNQQNSQENNVDNICKLFLITISGKISIFKETIPIENC